MTTPSLLIPSVGALVSALAACVCKQLREVGRPVCDCCVIHAGDVMPMDGCDCGCDSGTNGRLQVRVIEIAPVNSVVEGDCQAARVQVTAEVSVFRCVTVPDPENPPDCTVQSVEAFGFLTDEYAMRSAVACCDLAERAPGRWQVTPGSWTPAGPAGGCAGGVLRVTAVGIATKPRPAPEGTPR